MPNSLFSLAGRIALVTGGAGLGYGRQIVKGLAEAGAQVIVTSRSLDKAKAYADDLNQAGYSVMGIDLDLGDEGSINATAAKLRSAGQFIDILINNAAINHLGQFENINVEDWNKVLAVNITGTMLLTRLIAPMMLDKQQGSIINLSSIYGIVSPDQRIYGESKINSPLVYGVTKAAIIQMTRYWATYWSPHIRVNSITPGGLFSGQDPEFVANYIHKTPLQRMAKGDDIVGAAIYLASDASAWVTGHNLVVDGGWTVW